MIIYKVVEKHIPPSHLGLEPTTTTYFTTDLPTITTIITESWTVRKILSIEEYNATPTGRKTGSPALTWNWET